MANPRGGQKKKVKKDIPNGVVHIQATFNNTLITFTDMAGNAVSWCSAGSKGFRGSEEVDPLCGAGRGG